MDDTPHPMREATDFNDPVPKGEEPKVSFPDISSSTCWKDGVRAITSDSNDQVPFLVRSVNRYPTALEPMKDLRIRVAEPISPTYRDEGDLRSNPIQELIGG